MTALPAHIQSMLASEGFYAVSADLFVRRFSVVEVEPDGTCHQLTPSPRFARDGVLVPEKWNPKTMVVGPFKRPSAAEAMADGDARLVAKCHLSGDGADQLHGGGV